MIIDGKKIAQKIIDGLKQQPKPNKILAAISVGDNSSFNFLKQKEGVAKELGIDFRIYKFPKDIKNDELRKEVGKISLLKKVGGVIVQLPLPEHLNRHYILNVIPREKDVDVLGERALGAFYTGRNPVLPPAVGVVEEILNSQSYILNSKKIAAVGLGFLVGKPIATWLMGKTSEIYLLDEGSDLAILNQADIVISGVGKSCLIKPEMLKAGAGIIDFGYSIEHETKNKIRGDLDVSGFKFHDLGFYTPTPGGTGPILIAKLFENFYKLNKND